MPLTQANLETALNVTFTGTPNLPLFDAGDVVYRESEQLQDAGDNDAFLYTPYCVLDGMLKLVGSTVEDLNGVNADGSSGDDAEYMWWFQIQNNTTQAITSEAVHQSDLKTLAQIKTIIGTEVGDWEDPA